MTAPPTTELEAAQALSAALCQFQQQVADHGTTAGLLASAHEFGFSWFSRPATAALGTQVVLRHVGGSAFDAIGDDPALLLLGLLGGGFSDLYAVTIDDPAQPAEPTHAGPAAAPEPVAPAPSARPAIRAKGGDAVTLARAATPAPEAAAQPEPEPEEGDDEGDDEALQAELM